VHECICTDYYECVNDAFGLIAALRFCPPDMFYDNYCLSKNKTTCNLFNPNRKSSFLKNPGKREQFDDDGNKRALRGGGPRCPKVEIILFMLRPKKDRYYVCIDENRVLVECPEGLHFDIVRKICNYPLDAN